MNALTKFHNPLDDFQSYSVQYIMLACRTTEDARPFMGLVPGRQVADVDRETLSAIGETRFLGDPISYNGTKDVAYLVMDTRRFSQFTIERLKYETLINGLETNSSHGNLATTIEMTILDSVGISFINFLQWLMDSKMQCNFDGMIFMLKVIFVGHKPDGTTETVQSLTIPMHLFKLEVNLTFAKGAYTAEFMPNINFDAGKHNRWLNISQASTYFTGPGNTLGGIIDSFEKELNKKSAAFYADASSLLQKKSGATGKYGRLVKYMITIPEKWNEYLVRGWGTAAATETIFSKLDAQSGKSDAAKAADATKAGKPLNTTMSVELGMQITDVLDLIFKQVPEIAALGNKTDAKGKTTSVSFYNHLVGITSNNDVVTVHVDVVAFVVPDVVLDQTKAVQQGDADFYREISPGVRVPKDFIEFHYIYTGRNKDILNFDMKIQDLQWMLASNLDMGAGVMSAEVEKGQADNPIVPNPQAELVTARAYDPLLLPKNTKAELENFSQFASLTQRAEDGEEVRKNHQQYTKNLSAFYAASPITTNITIKGNPDIMLKFSMPDFLPHPADTGTISDSTVKAKYRKDLTDRILKDNTDSVNNEPIPRIAVEDGMYVVKSLSKTSYASAPVFVKINVKGPNVNFLTNEMKNGEDFATEIIQNNYYVVMKVTNLIEGAMFTQDLELYSHNVFGRGKMAGAPSKEVQVKK